MSQYRTETVKEQITSLSRAAELAGIPLALEQQEAFDVPPYGDVDARLQVDANAAEALADWFAFAFDVLTEFLRRVPRRGRAVAARAAVAGALRRRRRCRHGRPGRHLRPVAGRPVRPAPVRLREPLGRNPPDPFYDSPFGGAWLRYADVVAAPDPRAAALGLLREARRRRLGY